MNRSEVARQAAGATGQGRKEAEAALEALLDAIGDPAKQRAELDGIAAWALNLHPFEQLPAGLPRPEAVTFACSLLRLRRCDHAARKCPHPCYCMAFAEAVRIDGLRGAPTAVVPAQTMNCPPTSRLACGPEGFRPVRMRHALGVLFNRGTGAFTIERRSSTPIARDCSCRTASARPRSGH